MKNKTALTVGFAVALMFQAALVLAQSRPGETMVRQRPEEYQLRVLESQIQMLRYKLYAGQRMEEREKAEWLEHYNQVAKRLEGWNKFAGRYGLSE